MHECAESGDRLAVKDARAEVVNTVGRKPGMFRANNRNVLRIVADDVLEIAVVCFMCRKRTSEVDLCAHDVILAACEFDEVVLRLVHQREEISKERRLVHAPDGISLIAGRKHTVKRNYIFFCQGCRFCNCHLICAVRVRAACTLARDLHAARLIAARTREDVIFDLAGDGFGNHFDNVAFKRGQRHFGRCAGCLDQLDDFVARQGNGSQAVGGGGNACVLRVKRRVTVRAFDGEFEIAGDVEDFAALQIGATSYIFLMI